MHMFILVTMDSEIFSEQIADIKAKMIIDIIFNILTAEFI